MVCELIKGINECGVSRVLKMKNYGRTCSIWYKLKNLKFKEISKHEFTVRVVDEWNKLKVT